MPDRCEAVVCILAHNEESNIRRTLQAIIDGNTDAEPVIRVYANGCTDNTHAVVREMAQQFPQIELIEISRPSKPNAWNRAFADSNEEIIIFADADVIPSAGAISRIIEKFNDHSDMEIVSCESWPDFQAVGWQQKLTGFMQIPVAQDFLIGHFYGLRRSAFAAHFVALGLDGLPEGIAGEDAFLEGMMTPGKLMLADSKVKYEPPMLEDYYKYLGRIKWQNQQISLFNQGNGVKVAGSGQKNSLVRLAGKLSSERPISRLALGVSATAVRMVFKQLKRRRIAQAYQKLGPVTQDGAWVLSEATRSTSCK